MSKKQQKGHRRKSPQGGWGAGSKEPTQKNILFYYYLLQYQQAEISETSWSLYEMKPRSYNSAKILNFSERGDPWEDLNAPKATFKQQLLFFLLCLLKDSEHVRMKCAQKHFGSTFGSAYFKPNKTTLKLAKTVKKEPRKASFPWDIGLLFGNPMQYALISIFNIFKI